MARPSRRSTPERVRLSSACTTFTDLAFILSRSGTWAGTGPAWWARSTSAEASTFRCPLDSCGWGRGERGRENEHQCCSRVTESPRPQTAPATHILNNKRPLFGFILVHMGVLGTGGTGEYGGCWGRGSAGIGRACAGSGGAWLGPPSIHAGPSRLGRPPASPGPSCLSHCTWQVNATPSEETSGPLMLSRPLT